MPKPTNKREVAQKAAEPEPAAPEMPSMGGSLKQLMMLPVMWGSSRLNLEDPMNLIILQVVFGCTIFVAYMLILLAVYRAKAAGNTDRVTNPGASQYISADDKASDGSVTAKVYDVAKLGESKLQLMMSAAITSFIHLKFGYTQPLLMICLMQPMQLWDNPAMHIHLRGKSGAGYTRPWKGAHADNPLAQWAENKKAEVDERKKK